MRIAGRLAHSAPSPRRRRPSEKVPTRLVLTLLLVEIEAGQSTLGALQRAAAFLPGDEGLGRVARVATVSGLQDAAGNSSERLRPVVTQLARAQRSGASLAATLTRLIDEDLAEERATRLARARALPTRLLVPLTLLMLPGLILLLYAPSLIGLYEELTGTWG
jgi:hypothetical protein